MRYHVLHGMTWATDLDLKLPAVSRTAPDLLVVRGPDREVGNDAPAGTVICHLAPTPEQPLFTFSRTGGGEVLLRFHRLCDFVLSPDLDRAVCHAVPDTDPDFLSVLACGMLATVVLILRGHPVLHGSAVDDGGSAIALVGASGMGKSTLSTLLCRTGAPLITDDVLRLDDQAGVLVCRSGPTESRLRPTASYLAEQEGVVARPTADGRTAVLAQLLAEDCVPLRVLAVPYPTRESDEVEVQWLSPKDALLELLRFPRIVGWSDPATTAAHFAFLGKVVAAVPVARLRVPWREQLDHHMAEQVRGALTLG